MRDFSIAVEIAAPPERVWAIMRDVERWPEWTASITSVTRLDDRPFGVGARARVLQPKLRPAIWEVTRFEEQRGFTWISRAPGISVDGHHDVRPTPGGSRATLAIHFGGILGGLVGWALQGLNRKYLELEAAGLKKRSESVDPA